LVKNVQRRTFSGGDIATGLGRLAESATGPERGFRFGFSAGTEAVIVFRFAVFRTVCFPRAGHTEGPPVSANNILVRSAFRQSAWPSRPTESENFSRLSSHRTRDDANPYLPSRDGSNRTKLIDAILIVLYHSQFCSYERTFML
jgi:hypothetical protein